MSEKNEDHKYVVISIGHAGVSKKLLEEAIAKNLFVMPELNQPAKLNYEEMISLVETSFDCRSELYKYYNYFKGAKFIMPTSEIEEEQILKAKSICHTIKNFDKYYEHFTSKIYINKLMTDFKDCLNKSFDVSSLKDGFKLSALDSINKDEIKSYLNKSKKLFIISKDKDFLSK